MTEVPVSIADLTTLEVIHRMSRIIRARLAPEPAPSLQPDAGAEQTDFYRAVRSQLKANARTEEIAP